MFFDTTNDILLSIKIKSDGRKEHKEKSSPIFQAITLEKNKNKNTVFCLVYTTRPEQSKLNKLVYAYCNP